MTEFRIGDNVGAQDDDMINPQPVFGKIESIDYLHEQYWINTGAGQLAGPYPYDQVWPDPSAHVDYPHEPGMLYDCPACEAMGTLDPE